ncbi:MAG: adenylate/guanylate cyclase domain-containing protein [Proteobacteria bacterium]|nr:adenylate/guanylate cyclase domain-containing protein [Pseudomonadota bacterium]
MPKRLSALLPALLLLAALLGLRAADPVLLQGLRAAVFDEYQRLAPRVWEDAGVRIVDIDEESLARFGQWPWPRPILAQLTRRLADMGAAAIAFDIVFAEPDRTSPRAILPLWAMTADDPALTQLAARVRDHDEVLRDVLHATPSVLGFALSGETSSLRTIVPKWGLVLAGPDPRPFLPAYRGATLNLPGLETASKGLGVFTTGFDGSGIVRRVPLMLRLADASPIAQREIFPSLAAEALRVAQDASTYVVRSVGASGQVGLGAETGIVDIKIGEFTAKTDAAGRVQLYDTGPVPERTVPAWRVLLGELPADALDGSIVFVGTSAVGLKDLRATPLNPVAAGVEVHAQIAEQIVTGTFLDRPDWATGAEFVGLALFGLALIGLLALHRAMLGAAALLLGVAGAFAGTWYLFRYERLLFDPVYPALAAVLLYMVQSLTGFLKSEAERRQVRGAFGRYLAPALVEQLARDPDRLALGGEMKPITLMFMDIRGFTPISEQFDAHGLTRFLNRFLTRMTACVLDSGGTVDKYMGDAIMAFWNAPMDVPGHPKKALGAALAMLAGAKAFDAEWRTERAAEGLKPVPVKIGIGLNTGICCVGNMGAEQRFDYSAIGDDVNLCSRLESQSKAYGLSLLVAEATAEACADAFCLLEIDLLRVKGKTRPARIFTAVAGAPDDAFIAWKARHDAALAAYRAQDWAGARATIAALRGQDGGALDGFYSVLEARIAAYEAEPPSADWDGVHVATEK